MSPAPASPVIPSPAEPVGHGWDGAAEGLAGTLAARALAGGGWALLTLALALAAGVVRTVVVANLLDARELGLMGIALLALGTVEAFTATGVETALVSHPGDVRDDLDAAFTVQAARGVLVAAAVWALAPLAASFFAAPEAVPLIRVLGAVPVLRGVANPAVALVVRRIEFARLFWWSVPEAAVGFALAVGVALVRHDAWALVVSAVGAQVAATVASYAVLPRRPRLVLDGRGARRLLGYGQWVGASRILMFLSLSADNAIVGRFLGAGALGLYQLAFRLSELAVVTVTRAAVQVALPAFTALRDGPRLRAGFRAMLGVVLAANCAFAAAVLLLAGPVLGRVLGPAWLSAIPVLRILAVAMVFRAVVVVASELFHAVRRPRLTLEVNAVRLAVMLAAIFPLMHRWGMEGVAASVLLAGLAAAALSLLRVRSLFQ